MSPVRLHCAIVPDDALLWNAPKPPPRKPRPLEPVWTMRKDGKQTECGLLGHGEYGWEVQLLRDGAWFYGRRWITRALALAEADAIRRQFERDGWKPLD